MPYNNGKSCLGDIVSLQDLAALTVTSERTLQRLVKDGTIPLAKDKRGTILCADALCWGKLSHVLSRICATI